jgi:hypothetical protein
MDRMDKKFKVHQDKEDATPYDGISSYNTSLHFFNSPSVAPLDEPPKYAQKLFFEPGDNGVDGDENENDDN